MYRKRFILIIIAVVACSVGFWIFRKSEYNPDHYIGEPIDSLHRVIVYYNGSVGHVLERNLTDDKYNLGLKYQCVEFVKRYYYEYLNHRMPDTYGHAKDFFDKSLKDGQTNPQRNLVQYTNPSKSQPKVSDLVIFGPTLFNRYGHVAIISDVSNHEVEIIQQNPGPKKSSREKLSLIQQNGLWRIESDRLMGWLRKEE